MPGTVPSIDIEDGCQLALLTTPLREPQSGRTRYAAAMYFYQRGLVSAECLEVFRICSPFDHEDPLQALKDLGLSKEIEDLKSADQATGNTSS